jgi:hypothetical protein
MILHILHCFQNLLQEVPCHGLSNSIKMFNNIIKYTLWHIIHDKVVQIVDGLAYSFPYLSILATFVNFYDVPVVKCTLNFNFLIYEIDCGVRFLHVLLFENFNGQKLIVCVIYFLSFINHRSFSLTDFLK